MRSRAGSRLGGRARAGMLVAAFLLLAGLFGATAFLARPSSAIPQNTATRLLPPDGHREVWEHDGGVTVREYAFSTGAPMLASGPMLLFFANEDPERLIGGHYLRLLESTVAAGDASHSVSVLELDESGVRRVLDVAGQQMQQWHPAPTVLPAGLQAGSSWRSTGSVHRFEGFAATETVGYDFSARASEPTDPGLASEGCLDIVRTERLDAHEETRTETWCPGQGIVAGSEVGAALPGTQPQLDLEASWQPETWTVHEVDLNKTPPMMWGSHLPQAGTSEVLVVAHQTTGDLLFAPGADVDLARRTHPGGDIVALASFGDLVVAGTTRATATAYDIDGVWQWEAPLPDVATHEPALVDGRVVLADGSGNLTALDARTGERVWRASLPDQVISAPLGCGPLTVAGTTAAEAVLVDAAGEVVAAVGLSDRSSHFACGRGGEVFSAGLGRLDRITQDGRIVASVHMGDAVINDVHATGGVVITSSSRALTGYDDATLERLWRIEGSFFDTVAADGVLVAIDTGRIVALDAQGQELGSWPATAARDGFTAHLVPFADGVGVVSPEQLFTRLR